MVHCFTLLFHKFQQEKAQQTAAAETAAVQQGDKIDTNVLNSACY